MLGDITFDDVKKAIINLKEEKGVTVKQIISYIKGNESLSDDSKRDLISQVRVELCRAVTQGKLSHCAGRYKICVDKETTCSKKSGCYENQEFCNKETWLSNSFVSVGNVNHIPFDGRPSLCAINYGCGERNEKYITDEYSDLIEENLEGSQMLDHHESECVQEIEKSGVGEKVNEEGTMFTEHDLIKSNQSTVPIVDKSCNSCDVQNTQQSLHKNEDSGVNPHYIFKTSNQIASKVAKICNCGEIQNTQQSSPQVKPRLISSRFCRDSNLLGRVSSCILKQRLFETSEHFRIASEMLGCDHLQSQCSSLCANSRNNEELSPYCHCHYHPTNRVSSRDPCHVSDYCKHLAIPCQVVNHGVCCSSQSCSYNNRDEKRNQNPSRPVRSCHSVFTSSQANTCCVDQSRHFEECPACVCHRKNDSAMKETLTRKRKLSPCRVTVRKVAAKKPRQSKQSQSTNKQSRPKLKGKSDKASCKRKINSTKNSKNLKSSRAATTKKSTTKKSIKEPRRKAVSEKSRLKSKKVSNDKNSKAAEMQRRTKLCGKETKKKPLSENVNNDVTDKCLNRESSCQNYQEDDSGSNSES